MIPDRLRPYIDLIATFSNGKITACDFEQQYLRLFKNDQSQWPTREYEILNDLFIDVDAFCADASIRTKDDLDESQLLIGAKRALQNLKKEYE